MSIRENMIDLYECDKQSVTVCYIKYLWAIEKKISLRAMIQGYTKIFFYVRD